jgi:hypothetical protein
MIKSRRIAWAEHDKRIEETKNLHKILVGENEGKRPLGRHRRGWEDTIKNIFGK